MIRRLFYIAPVRMPTEKAHGYQIAKMCEAWSALGIDVHLVVPRRNNPIDRDAFDYYGIPRSFSIHYLPVRDWFDATIIRAFHLSSFAYAVLMLDFLIAVRQFAAAEISDQDAVYTRAWEVAWLFRARRSLIWEVHEITRFQRLTPGLYARVAGVVVLTTCLRDILLVSGASSERVLIAPDAVDMRLFHDALSASEARRRLGVPPHRIAIGYVGRLMLHGKIEKGISQLLRAFALLRMERGDLSLVIVGGPLSAISRYRREARLLGVADDVIFAGHVPHADVSSWMAACDILTIPWPKTAFSSWYTSPLKLFEYMASGKAIVTSDLPSLRDVLDEHVAVFAPPGDVAGLAAACSMLIRDPSLRDRLGRAARTAALRHTWDARAASISAFIDAVLPVRPSA